MIRESWAVQTECAECGKERRLTGGLCLPCSESMGYSSNEEGS
jgi:hypothetical protein